jgi:hypothetical protein
LFLFSAGQGFRGLFCRPESTLHWALCKVRKQKVFSVSLTLLCAAFKLNLPHRA